MRLVAGALLSFLVTSLGTARAAELDPISVDAQPLGANVNRVLQALGSLGSPLPKGSVEALTSAAKSRDAAQIQRTLDPHVLFVVSLNPESRVKVERGPARALLQ